MPIRVDTTARFDRQLDRLEREFKAPIRELDDLIARLEQGGNLGDKMPRVGFDVYKVRLSNPAARIGKRGGFRVLYYFRLANQVILIAIYAKSQRTNISSSEIRRLILELD